MHEQSSADDDAESVASGSAAGAAGASTPARRRPRRPSLLTAVAAARPLSLLNLRLSLMDRDFTEQDFDLLVRLDELEAGADAHSAARTEPGCLAVGLVLPSSWGRGPFLCAGIRLACPPGREQRAGAGRGQGGPSWGRSIQSRGSRALRAAKRHRVPQACLPNCLRQAW